jgi:hypothetical protein
LKSVAWLNAYGNNPKNIFRDFLILSKHSSRGCLKPLGEWYESIGHPGANRLIGIFNPEAKQLTRTPTAEGGL